MSTSGSSNFSPKTARSFGNFAPESKASSLFDAAFSKPVARKRFQKAVITSATNNSSTLDSVLPSVSEPEVCRNSPVQVFSPPVSLPESLSTDGAADIDNGLSSSSEDDVTPYFHVSSDSNSKLSDLNSGVSQSTTLQLQSPEKMARTSAFDYIEEDIEIPPPSLKRAKILPDTSSPNCSKFLLPKERKPVYQHKWTAAADNNNDDDDDNNNGNEENDKITSTRIFVSTSAPRRGNYSHAPEARVRNVKEAYQCLESGEHDDFKQDIEYILSTMNGDSSVNVKCLSAISLARKCITTEFRQFIRSEGMVNNLFKGLADAPLNQNLALCAATVIYLMSRDFISMAVDTHSLRLLTQLLRIEKLDKDPEQEKYAKMVNEVFAGYLEKMEAAGKKIVFEIAGDNITPSSLVLEALVFVLAKSSDEGLKTEMLNLGVLQWVVGKVEKIVLRMLHDKLVDLDTIQQLILLERCFRILETCTLFHKKNQAFLISHRGSLLIQMCGKLMAIIHETISRCDSESTLAKSHIACLSLMARVLMNLSHENELCCTKLGQMPGFLPLCLSSYTFLAPKFAPAEKKFDLYVMLTSLLVNLVERCNSNRRKLIDTHVKVYLLEGPMEKEEKALDALSKLFTIHEAKARNIDEDLDKDLAFEEPIDDGKYESDGEEENDGRLDRGKLHDLSESEMLQAVQSAMNKASAHMEDSVVASYVALLIGCLLQQNEEYASIVRANLEGGSLNPMIDQLQRFLEFMKIASSKSSGCRSIERIIDLLERLN